MTLPLIMPAGASLRAFTLAHASFSGNRASLSGYGSTCRNFCFSPDGTKMFSLVGARVVQFRISVPWDITKIEIAAKELYVGAQATTGGVSVAISSDGTKLYVTSNASDIVYQYALSTPFDLSTGSYSGKSKDVSAQADAAYGIVFMDSGSKMLVCGQTNDRVYQYALSTAWDVSTASYSSLSLDVSAQTTAPVGIAINENAKRLLVGGYLTDSISQYSASSAFDVSTASYDSLSLDVSAQISVDNLTGIAFSADGRKLFAGSDASFGFIYEYNL